MKSKLPQLLKLILVALLFILPGRIGLADQDKPIRIGLTYSNEGRYKEPSKMILDAFKMWQMETNKQGGLLDRPVEFVVLDDKSDPAIAKAAYEKLVYEEKVDLLFSPYSSPLTLVASEVSEKNNMVMLAVAASAEIIWDRGYRNVFGMYALGKRYFIGQLDLMARRGLKSLALIYDQSSPFNIDVIEGTEKWARRFNLKVVLKKGFTDGAIEIPRIAQQLKSIDPIGVVVSAYPPDCYLILDSLKKLSYKPRIMGMTIAPIHLDFYAQAGEIAEKIFGPSQWEPDERIPFPGTKTFIESFRKFSGKMPSYHAGAAYAASQLISRAIKKAGKVDNQFIRDYLATLDTVTVIGRFKVDQTGKQIGHNTILIQWQEGKKEIVWPTNMRTSAPQL